MHAFGRGELWQRKGEFRFRAYAIEQFGLGQLLRRIEEVRLRLAQEGLFAAERKRPLPFLPGLVGLVCGSDAAAKRDVVETATARHPGVRFRIVEAAVQGGGAAAAVTAALRALDADPAVDVIVLARGGGSVEDLLAFSDEGLCRAVAECSTPVVSAIGHEQDTPLVDLVADVRAGTPSLAAKLIVPDRAAVGAELDALLARAGRALEGRATHARRHLQLLVARPAFADPAQLDHGPAGAARRCVGVAAAAAGAAARARDGPAAKRPRPAAPARPRGDARARLRDRPGRRRRGRPRRGGGRRRRAGRRAAGGRAPGRPRRGGAAVSAGPSFEQARDELEQIVRKLEDGSTSLDEALALWERGEQLHALCRARLDAAEERVAELLERLGRTPAAGAEDGSAG